MVRAIELILILLFGLISNSVNGLDSIYTDQLDMIANIQPENRIQPEKYEQLKQLQLLSNEFTTQFQNISMTDIQISNTGEPTTQDMQCLEDMQRLMKGLSVPRLWAYRMIDSWGTLPSGIFYYNLIDMGNYKECTKINKVFDKTHRMRGQYCFAKIPLSMLPNPQSMSIGVCFPSSCTATHMDIILGKLLKRLLKVDYTGQLVDQKTCKTAESKPLDGLTIFTIVLLSIFGGLALLATLWDYFVCQDQEQLPQLVKIFSIRATSRAVFRVTEIKANPNVIGCLHGMRCMSLIWVVFGHEYMFGGLGPNINRLDVYYWFEKPFSSFLSHALFSVETFFFLSSFLLFMLGLRNMEKTKGKLNVPLMYLHRYLRLTPLLAVSILIYIKFLPLFVDGPMAQRGFDDYSRCERNWIWTILYLQNYVTKEMCLTHSWYLAVDMQLYIISPLLLIALYKWGKKAAIGIAILIVLLTAWLFTIIMIHKYSLFIKNSFQNLDSQYKIHLSTHQHASPWLIGALFGYFVHVNRGKSFKLHPLMVWVGWLTALAIFFASIFALYPYANWKGPALPTLVDALYFSLSRAAWPLGLCWVVFACMQGYGGLANSFLSSPLWQPLSRLSYAVYVFHFFIEEITARRIQTNTYFSNYNMMLRFWGDFGFTVLLAYVLHIAIEAPLGGLENMMLNKLRAASESAPEIKQNLAAAELESQVEEASKPIF